MKDMRTESATAGQSPWRAALTRRVDPILFALLCALMAAMLYTAGTFFVRIYDDDDARLNVYQRVPPAQTR